MSEENLTIANRFHKEIFQDGDLAAADELLSKDFIWQGGMGLGRNQPGPEGVKQIALAINAAFLDREITHEKPVALGDTVLIRWSMTGTHKASLLGIPPTDKIITVTGRDTFLIEGGKIIQLTQEMDQFDPMQSRKRILTL
jgi:predicted ester cyclase